MFKFKLKTSDMKFITVVALLIGITIFLLLPGDSEGKKGPLVTDVVSLFIRFFEFRVFQGYVFFSS